MPELSTEAYLGIDRSRGRVSECNPAAAALLGADAEELAGRPWHKVLGCSGPVRAGLSAVIDSGQRLYLPPFLMSRNGVPEAILGGMALPRVGPREGGLLIWPLLKEGNPGIEPRAADAVAVLGLDRLRGDAEAGFDESRQLVAAMRDSLLEILRPDDGVSDPFGTSLIVVLRDVAVEGARDICRALMSHLHRMRRQFAPGADGTRIAAGLAFRGPRRSALSAILGANNALLRARTGTDPEQLRSESDADFGVLVEQALYGTGILSAPLAGQPAPAAAAGGKSVRPGGAAATGPYVQPMETGIEGYVVDNMEGAVDQALFLARLDLPVAIIGPAGTGKMYVARIIHDATGSPQDSLVQLDCREFRSRKDASARIARELAGGEGRTLVFKSPHLMHADAQVKLARQISSRTLADVSPPRALPGVKLIALFPAPLEVLVKRGELAQPLASAFAGLPINVPPIRDRKQAVLRWAHKILGQEGALRDRDMKGFTPDAERVMLRYDWPGNISEMRQCIANALERTDKTWLTPLDLGLFTGIETEADPSPVDSGPFLQQVEHDTAGENYVQSPEEALDLALGKAVHTLLELDLAKPLGQWLEDEAVDAALERYRGDIPRAAEFLHTRPRNISRWMSGIRSRDEERQNSALWQEPRRTLHKWIRELPHQEHSPLAQLETRLIARLEAQADKLSNNRRARILGVSTPTYLKRLREMPRP